MLTTGFRQEVASRERSWTVENRNFALGFLELQWAENDARAESSTAPSRDGHISSKFNVFGPQSELS
jgi:hypothetical protein